jgi:hypothetical protein
MTSNRMIRIAASALIAILAGLALSAPAQAASYRQFRTIKSGYCLRPASSWLDVRANSCSISPTRYRDWKVIDRGKLNGHHLWQIENRGTGQCLSVGGNDVGRYGYVVHESCSQSSYQIWEIFPVAAGAITLKSYGDWVLRGAHACLMYLGGTGALNTDVRACNTSNINQRWR